MMMMLLLLLIMMLMMMMTRVRSHHPRLVREDLVVTRQTPEQLISSLRSEREVGFN